MRSLRFSLLALALAMPSVTPAQDPHDSTEAFTLHASTAVSVEFPAPAPNDQPSFPVEYLAIGLAAAAAKKGARRARRGDVAMIVDSQVHVMRDNKKGDPELKVIKGGVLVEDTDPELTEEEIDELTARRVIRPATEAELAAMEQGDVAGEREALVREQEQDVAQLRAKHVAERTKLEEGGKLKTPEAVSKLEERQASELSKLQTKHVDALNAVGE